MYPILYNPASALQLLPEDRFREIETDLNAARDEMRKDIQILKSGSTAPEPKQPLDAGFIELPRKLLSEFDNDRETSLLGRIQSKAESLRDEIDRFVILGIGGSYMGARALFEALCHPYHNELDRNARNEVPKIYFEGNNLDDRSMTALLELLTAKTSDRSSPDDRWGMTVISKSGGTIETAVAFRILREAMADYYGADSADLRKLIVPITGPSGKLRTLSECVGYEDLFEIPDHVGGRFSIFTPVGLFPAAMFGLNVEKLLTGAQEMTERFFNAPMGENPVVDYVATCHLLEEKCSIDIRVLSTWGTKLESVGFWYDQLLSESLGKQERGAMPVTVVNTRDLHSRGQQHQQGKRDKLITNLIVEETSEKIAIPNRSADTDIDELNWLAGRTVHDLQKAAIAGTNRAYREDTRPIADIRLPKLNEHALGQFFQMMMLATVLEGRLLGINPYGQPGVEAYKHNMIEELQQTEKKKGQP